MLGGVAIDADIHKTVRYFADSQQTRRKLMSPIYSKGVEPDFSEALIVRNNATIEDVCDQIHRTLKESFKYALVWGQSAMHVPQRVGLGHVVADEDVVSIVAK